VKRISPSLGPRGHANTIGADVPALYTRLGFLVVVVADDFGGQQDGQDNRNCADAADHNQKDVFHNVPHLVMNVLMILSHWPFVPGWLCAGKPHVAGIKLPLAPVPCNRACRTS
jgi:hypothetical protein